MKKEKVTGYEPNNMEFLMWFVARHPILYKHFRKKCKSDIEQGKTTIRDADETEIEYVRLKIKEEELKEKMKRKDELNEGKIQ